MVLAGGFAFEYVAQTQSSHQVEIRARVNGFTPKALSIKAGQTLFLLDKVQGRVSSDGKSLQSDGHRRMTSRTLKHKQLADRFMVFSAW
jgi:hypothetical protein